MILCLPFVMFQGRAQEAIDHYLKTFPDVELLEIMHHPEGTEVHDPSAPKAPSTGVSGPPYPEDTAAVETVVDLHDSLVATAQLRIGAQVLMIQDSLVKQDFDFTPSISVAVVVDTEEEFSRIADGLAEGGEFLMEPGDYDFAKNFTWVKDKFGICWQINQPRGTPEPGAEAAEDVAQAKAPEWG